MTEIGLQEVRRPPRDSWRSRVYAAEDVLLDRHWYDVTMDWPEVEEFVSRVTTSRWYRTRWSVVVRPVLVRREKVSAMAWADGRITLPPFARCPLIILHEIAHLLTDAGEPDRYAAHGPEFCGVWLVRQFLGLNAHAVLVTELASRRVPVSDRALPRPGDLRPPSAVAVQRLAARKAPVPGGD